MGGAVSSGRDNNELIDNLMGSKYIRSRSVEMVFRALDRADYMLPAERDRAYKDLAWRSGALHMSAPCIYSEVMEGLELKPGLSFLNIGSGTGYLSTLVGLIIGSGGISHGVEIHGMVVDYANKRLKEFSENSVSLDEFDFCEPKFFLGNGLCLAPLQSPYDRVYCGAGCPEQYQNYFKQLIKVGGILVMPLNENLLQVRRVSQTEWSTKNLLNVSFATLRVPSDAEKGDHIRLDEQTPPKLQVLARTAIRAQMRLAVLSRQPELRAPAPPDTPAKKAVPRRICIPIEDDSDVEGLNALHDLDGPTGAQEMNALLSLVLSMGQNRVAGALRFDPSDSNSTSSSSDEGDDDDEPDDDDAPGDDHGGDPQPANRAQNRRNLIQTFENIEDMNRAIHRVINSVERPNVNGEAVEPSARGRLSLTLEYNTPNSDDTTNDSQEAPPSPPAPAAPPAPPAPAAPRRKHKKRRSHSRDLPEEVEIDIQKQKTETETAEPSTSSHSEEMELEAPPDPPASSGEEQAGARAAGTRHKLDSGLGEESPSCSSARTDSKTDEDGASEPRSDAGAGDVDDITLARRRLPKRSRCELGARSSSSESDAEAAPAFRHKRPQRPARAPRPARPPGRDARRVRLSIVMKRSVKELPLPYALKRYVNLHRCFEF